MNRLQFLSLLSPAVGSSVLVILAWMSSSQRLNRLEQVVDSLSRDLREFYRIPGKLEGRVDEIAHRYCDQVPNGGCQGDSALAMTSRQFAV